MLTIEKLTIKNFQAHKKLEVELDPHVTTIIGPSDVGKSAIIRALMWITTLHPSGTAFIREGSKQTTVNLVVDGQEILRTRSASINTYALDGKEFKAFGNDVPSDIRGLLNLSPVNFQSQHDSPFWFCETAGEVSRQLNQIVNLEIIDRTLANLDRIGREARTQIKVVTQQLDEAKELRSTLKWAKTAEQELATAEALHKVWSETQENHRGLIQITGDIEGYTIHRFHIGYVP